jgi:hypothetical protein
VLGCGLSNNIRFLIQNNEVNNINKLGCAVVYITKSYTTMGIGDDTARGA